MTSPFHTELIPQDDPHKVMSQDELTLMLQPGPSILGASGEWDQPQSPPQTDTKIHAIGSPTRSLQPPPLHGTPSSVASISLSLALDDLDDLGALDIEKFDKTALSLDLDDIPEAVPLVAAPVRTSIVLPPGCLSMPRNNNPAFGRIMLDYELLEGKTIIDDDLNLFDFGLEFKENFTRDQEKLGFTPFVARKMIECAIHAIRCLHPNLTIRLTDMCGHDDILAEESYGQYFLNNCSSLDLQCLHGYFSWEAVSHVTSEKSIKPMKSTKIFSNNSKTFDAAGCFYHSDLAVFHCHAFSPCFKKYRDGLYYEKIATNKNKILHLNNPSNTFKGITESPKEKKHFFMPIFRIISRIEQFMELFERLLRVLPDEKSGFVGTASQVVRLLLPLDIFRIFPMTSVGSKYMKSIGKYNGKPGLKDQVEDETFLHQNILPSGIYSGVWNGSIKLDKLAKGREIFVKKAAETSIDFKTHIQRCYDKICSSEDSLYLIQDIYDAFMRYSNDLEEEDIKKLPLYFTRGEGELTFERKRGKEGDISEEIVDFNVYINTNFTPAEALAAFNNTFVDVGIKRVSPELLAKSTPKRARAEDVDSGSSSKRARVPMTDMDLV